MNTDEKLELLKSLLLTDEREYAQSISVKISKLEETLRERAKLSEKVSPIIQDELLEFTERIPLELGPIITETLKTQIAESKDQVVEALYPIMGQMIKKYIAQEIKILSERIEQTTQDVFSVQTIKRKIKSMFTGVKEEELIISDLAEAELEQVFIIEKGSGILLGSYQIKETLDEDMISGMLTAIKAFVEDAFKTSTRNLQSIEYDLYEIHLHSFHQYYIASAISGTFTENLQNKLEDHNLKVSQNINKNKLISKREELQQFLIKQYSQFELGN